MEYQSKGFVLFDEIYEYQLQNFWSRINKGVILHSVTGEAIEIIHPGVWNKEEGPDFKEAVIKINGEKYKGDIEIHLLEKDWINHGHIDDSRYTNVILHVVKKISGAKLNLNLSTVVINDGIIKEFNSKNIDKFPKGYCSVMFKEISDGKLAKIFVSAGIKRFLEKSEGAADDILRYGVNQAILKRFFAALGYKKNTEQFLELYRRVSEYDLKSMNSAEISAVLWGESGFLPDPSQYIKDNDKMLFFIREKWNTWWKLRHGNRQEIEWKISGSRPQNHPCRRIAALDILISKFGVVNIFENIAFIFADLANNGNFWKNFKSVIISDDNLWDKYSCFNNALKRKTATLGEARALDITVNVFLPVLYAYEKINSLNQNYDIIGIYTKLPKGQNNIIIEMSSQRWLIPKERVGEVIKSAAAQQGMIYLYKNYCSRLNMDCSKCEMPYL